MTDDFGNEIPRRLRGRPRYGPYVVPYSTMVRDDGRPDFRVLDNDRHVHCLVDRRCGVCGQALAGSAWQVFIGGPLSVKTRTFTDPAMHEECARYSAIVCPYLRDADARFRMGARPPVAVGYVIAQDGDAVADVLRPDRMALYYCKRYDVIPGRPIPHARAHNHPKRIDWDTLPARTPGADT